MSLQEQHSDCSLKALHRAFRCTIPYLFVNRHPALLQITSEQCTFLSGHRSPEKMKEFLNEFSVSSAIERLPFYETGEII